jgi:CTP:molybdopterin cytidylyltransferase MocA
VSRVAVLILHAPAARDAGPLTRSFDAVRRANATRLSDAFRAAGADDVRIDDAPLDSGGLAGRIRAAVADEGAAEGLVLLGSGSIPLATASDLRRFVEVAGGPTGRAITNNRYSADVIAVAGARVLATLPDVPSDNMLPRWLAEAAGLRVTDLGRRSRLQMDLDTPLDWLLVRGRTVPGPGIGEPAVIPTGRVRAALGRVVLAARDPRCELLVAGRTSADRLRWLERSTASRTRALVEERGLRTRLPGQRPAASTLGLLLDAEGPDGLGRLVGRLADAALIDTRVLLAHRLGSDGRTWPGPEDRFASDLLLDEAIGDPWLRALTRSARAAPIPIVLGGHSLVGPGLHLALGTRQQWT